MLMSMTGRDGYEERLRICSCDLLLEQIILTLDFGVLTSYSQYANKNSVDISE